MTIPFKFGLGISVRCFKHKGQMKNIKFYTLYLDNNFPNIENIYYIHPMGKGIDLEMSRFQLTKTLKMNIRKNSTKKDRTNDSLIFGLGNILRLQVCSYHPGKMKHSRFHTLYNDKF